MKNYSSYSDIELKTTISSFRESKIPLSKQLIEDVFGIANESINRRLGIWKIFSGEFRNRKIDSYLTIAEKIVARRTNNPSENSYTDNFFLGDHESGRSVDSIFGSKVLDDAEECIIKNIVYVKESRKILSDSNIMLPSNFYKSISLKIPHVSEFRASDEQIRAGQYLLDNTVVEMDAGEGKTIAAAFAGIMHAIRGHKVHIITANDYLALRDVSRLRSVYESIGITVGTLLSNMGYQDRRETYKSTILYGTLREIGFDMLRDNLNASTTQPIQGKLDVAIVDEADQALIDEASTPLIIGSSPTKKPRSLLRIKSLIEDLIQRQFQVTRGIERAIESSPVNNSTQTELLAQIMLSNPESPVLIRQLSKSRKTIKSINNLIASNENYVPNLLTKNLFYLLNNDSQTVTLTERGHKLVESTLGDIFHTEDLELKIDGVNSSKLMSPDKKQRHLENLETRIGYRHTQINQVNQMLRAYTLLKRNVHYVVSDEKIFLVDRLTGRRRPDNKYQFGLQAALEAKEGLGITPDTDILGQISVRGLMLKYSHLSGITGTARDSEIEFQQAYGLDTVSVSPTYKNRRVDLPTMIFDSKIDKLNEIVMQTQQCQKIGIPVLIGTITVEQSEELGTLFTENNINYKRLDAVNNDKEAEIVKTAGSYGSVTLATNMAGRGTDILMDPDLNKRIASNYAAMAVEHLSKGAGSIIFHYRSTEEARTLESELSKIKDVKWIRENTGENLQTIVTKGNSPKPSKTCKNIDCRFGLYVIGSELNESRRVDLQLRGRTARQGNLGSARFIISYEDHLLAFSNSRKPHSMGKRGIHLRHDEGTLLQDWIKNIQSTIESENVKSRNITHEFDFVIEKRDAFFNHLRKQTLESHSFFEKCMTSVEQRSESLTKQYFHSPNINEYPTLFDAFSEELEREFEIDVENLWGLGIPKMQDSLITLLSHKLNKLRDYIGPKEFDTVSKQIFIKTVDDLRINHNSLIRDVLLSIQLCGYGQKKTVTEFIGHVITAEKQLENEIVEAFLPRIFRIQPKTPRRQIFEPTILKDIHEILV